MRAVLAALSLFVAVIPACSASFNPKACALDTDCGSNVCELQGQNGGPVCVSPASAAINIGMSVPLSGPSQELGTDLKLGVTLAFDAQNQNGGIRGRQLALQAKDDEYQPSIAETNAMALVNAQMTMTTPTNCPTTTNTTVTGVPPISQYAINRGPGAVLAFLGSIGTPTMIRAAPVALETGTVYFGAFTGATVILRDNPPSAGSCAPLIFNVRSSYAEEANATLQYFQNQGVTDYQHLVSFDQDDSFGDAGYNGLVAAWTAINMTFTPAPANPAMPIARFRYTRGDETTVAPAATAAEAYLASLLAADNKVHTVGIMMTDTYGPGTDFIQDLRTWQFAPGTQQTSLQMATRLQLHFSNLSFVGPNSLASRLKGLPAVATPSGPMQLTTDVVVSQVVPNYQSDSSELVTAFLGALNASNAANPSQTALVPTFTSLEGYIDARIFIAGLLANQGPFTPNSIVSALESLGDLSLGLGPTMGYSAMNHNYLTSVWGTAIQSDGTFSNVYFWSSGLPIQFYQ